MLIVAAEGTWCGSGGLAKAAMQMDGRRSRHAWDRHADCVYSRLAHDDNLKWQQCVIWHVRKQLQRQLGSFMQAMLGNTYCNCMCMQDDPESPDWNVPGRIAWFVAQCKTWFNWVQGNDIMFMMGSDFQ